MIKVLEHEHPLKLIDLHEDVEVSDDDEKEEEEDDVATKDVFLSTCKRCHEEINEYHRYYYKCTIDDDSCDYHLHKFCADLPITLKHKSYAYHITLSQHHRPWSCYDCSRGHDGDEVCYTYSGSRFIFFDVNCVVEEVDKRRIYHPSHPHPLVSLSSKPNLCECNACGKEHKGVFFQCTTCVDFALHTDCSFLPKRLLIQRTTNDIFRHPHPLTLSYSFPRVEQRAKYHPDCRVCGGSFDRHPDLWIYKCEKCIYYAHVDCATSRKEPFMSIFSIGKGPTNKNYKDADYPHLLHLPFPDQTYSIPKHLFFKDTGDEVSLQRINHKHGLILVDTEYIDSLGGPTSSKINSSIMCHNPMKKIQLLCNACLRPITEMPFYKCGANEDENCNFAIHEWCTRLPTELTNHPGHPQRALVLMPNVQHTFFNMFRCDACGLPCNGYAYGCLKCGYYVDVCCAFMPQNITHKSHPGHLLSIVKKIDVKHTCLMCLSLVSYNPLWGYFSSDILGFSCSTCDVYIHPRCALLLPETIRHAYDKHPMHLSYLPVENHKSEYFCEICEDPLNPHRCFYHCDECVQSVHPACAPVILCCETETYCNDGNSFYEFLNVKFGSIHNSDGHPHPLEFAQGIADDGQCDMCDTDLQYKLIFKCVECEFVIDYKCCKKLDKS